MTKKKTTVQRHPNLKWLLPILVIVILLFVFKMYYHENVNISNQNNDTTSIIPTVSTNNWQTYDDRVNGYTIKYPETWSYQRVTNEGGTSIRFYEIGVTPRQTYMMARGNEQLILSTITNQTLKELEANTKIPQSTIAGKPAIRLSTGAYIGLAPNLILSIHSPTYPQPAMEEVLNSLVVGN
jgi:hypothetical protein